VWRPLHYHIAIWWLRVNKCHRLITLGSRHKGYRDFRSQHIRQGLCRNETSPISAETQEMFRPWDAPRYRDGSMVFL